MALVEELFCNTKSFFIVRRKTVIDTLQILICSLRAALAFHIFICILYSICCKMSFLKYKRRRGKNTPSFYVRNERLICYLWSMSGGKKWVNQKIKEPPQRWQGYKKIKIAAYEQVEKKKEIKTSDSKGIQSVGPLGDPVERMRTTSP